MQFTRQRSNAAVLASRRDVISGGNQDTAALSWVGGRSACSARSVAQDARR